MHRGVDGFDPHPLGHGPIDVKRTKREYIRTFGIDKFLTTAAAHIGTVVADSLAEAGLTRDDPRLHCAVLPRLGVKAMEEAYVPPLKSQVDTEIVNLGTDSGHVGAGDLNANLCDLAARRLLEPGRFALILNGGGGFSFTSMVVSRPPHEPPVR